jgi:hypothetical protein
MEETGKKGWLDRLMFLGFAAGLLVTGFILGMVAIEFESPITETSRQAKLALAALTEQHRLKTAEMPPFMYYPIRHQGSGARTLAPGGFPGYTAFTSSDQYAAVRVIDEKGHEVFRWDLPFSTIWPGRLEKEFQVAEEAVFIRDFTIYPNGDLLALYESCATVLPGVGLVRVDRNGKVLWKNDALTHHDYCERPDGRIYALVNSFRTSPPWKGAEHIRMPCFDEQVAEISADGKVLKIIHLMDALANSPQFAPLLQSLPEDSLGGDFFHSNTANLITPEFAAHYPGLKAARSCYACVTWTPCWSWTLTRSALSGRTKVSTFTCRMIRTRCPTVTS